MGVLAVLYRILRMSGPAPDRAWAVRLASADGWRRILALRVLHLRFSPDVLLHIRALRVPADEKARLFSQAISHLVVGGTCKTTWEDRTRLADDAIVRHAAAFGQVRLLDVGTSDGTASLALIDRLPNLIDVILADRHGLLYARGPALLRRFLDGERKPLGIKIAGIYLHLPRETAADPSGFAAIATVNPLVAERIGDVEFVPFDARRDALRPPATVIKCANLLNREYFAAAELRSAAANLGVSLVDGGLLCISQNHPKYPDGEAYLILKRHGSALALIEERGGHDAVAALQPLPIALGFTDNVPASGDASATTGSDPGRD